MDNHHSYDSEFGTRPRRDFPLEAQPPNSNIPYSHPYHGPPPPPPPCLTSPPPLPPPFIRSAFQNSVRLPDTVPTQSTTPSSSSFHSFRYSVPEFRCPPPPIYGIGENMSGMGHQAQPYMRSSVPDRYHESHGSSQQESKSNLDFGLSMNSHNLQDAGGTQQMFESPSVYDNQGNSRSGHLTSGGVNVPQNTSKQEEEEEKLWMKNLEQRIVERERMVGVMPLKKNNRKSLKLQEIQQMVTQSHLLTNKLSTLKEKISLQKNEDQLLWDLINEAENIKAELNGILDKFQDPLFVEDVTRLISQRRKKRERRKKQHKLKVKLKKSREEMWKKEEEMIDSWREKLRQKEEEKRREIAFKAETDSILGEVRQKQMDVVKMQQLLEGLISLRIARLNKGAAHGFIATPQQDHLFTTTMKKISDIVNAQMEDYKLEEQTLRVMMEETTSYQRSNTGKEGRDLQKLENAVKKVLFGDGVAIDKEIYDEYTASDRCLETLIKRRNEWDQFICREDNPLASSVPLGWVVPPENPSPDWNDLKG